MDSPSPHARLAVETIGTGDIEKVVLVTGILKPAVQVNVGAQVNGQLRKLYVRQGERVKKDNCWRKSTRRCRSRNSGIQRHSSPALERKSSLRKQRCCATARSWIVSA